MTRVQYSVGNKYRPLLVTAEHQNARSESGHDLQFQAGQLYDAFPRSTVFLPDAEVHRQTSRSNSREFSICREPRDAKVVLCQVQSCPPVTQQRRLWRCSIPAARYYGLTRDPLKNPIPADNTKHVSTRWDIQL